VNEVQVAGGGGTYAQDWVRTGLPPVQPAGDDVATVRDCWPLAGQVAGVQALYVNDAQVFGGGGTYAQATVRTGLPPVQPAGADDTTVRVCWPLAGHTAGESAEYVNEVQVFGGGGTYAQATVRTGFPPVQPAGAEDTTVRVCWPLAGHTAGESAE
jgi:hypothetical protein